MNISDYNPIRQRFFMIFKSLHITQTEFGKKLGKSQNLISAILNNKRAVSGDMIQLLRYKFNVNPDYLLYGRSPMFIEKMELNRRIPILGDIPAGEWKHWIDAYSANAGDDYVSAPELKGSYLFAVRVEGDSMEPLLYKGDIIVIDPDKQFSHGIAVVRHNWGYKIRNVKIRNVFMKSEQKLYLCPQNSKYDPEEITADNDTRVYVPIKVISLKDI